MTHANAIDKILLRLNKLYSQDYNDIDLYKIEEAVNKGVDDVIRRLIKGNTQKHEGDEETSVRVDDLAILLVSTVLSTSKKDIYNDFNIPNDYRYFKRLTPIVTKGSCSNIRIQSIFVEEANIDTYLIDYNSQPSFDFEETFHTEFGKTFKVYHNKDFTIEKVELTYYRNPKYLALTTEGPDTVWEFKEDLSEIIIDEAVKILAGDTENINAFQLAENRIEKNN